MAEHLPDSGGAAPPEGLAHHISSVAHLFFAEDESAASAPSARECLQLAVVCFNDTPIAAFAGGVMVSRTRQLALDGVRRGVRLAEESGLAWSVCNFLAGDTGSQEPNSRLPLGPWSWPAAGADPATRNLVSWVHLRDNSLDVVSKPLGAIGGCLEDSGAHSLVVCLLAREVSALKTGVRLGRLLGQLGPARLEILVFPNSWTAVPANAVGGRTPIGWTKDDEKGLLTGCRELTRALGGSCSVAITKLPAGGVNHALAPTTAILHKLVARLIGDFWVDPNS